MGDIPGAGPLQYGPQREVPMAPTPPSRGLGHAMKWPGLAVALSALVMLGIELAPGLGGDRVLPEMTAAEEAGAILGTALAGMGGALAFKAGSARLAAGEGIQDANVVSGFWWTEAGQMYEATQRHTEQLIEALRPELARGNLMPSRDRTTANLLTGINALLAQQQISALSRAAAEQVQENLMRFVAPQEQLQLLQAVKRDRDQERVGQSDAFPAFDQAEFLRADSLGRRAYAGSHATDNLNRGQLLLLSDAMETANRQMNARHLMAVGLPQRDQ
jgi:hypothetical protein